MKTEEVLLSLAEAIDRYGCLVGLPQNGQHVLFESEESCGTFSICLGEVINVSKPQGKAAEITVRTVYTYLPNGTGYDSMASPERHFPAGCFAQPITERMLSRARRREQAAAQARSWAALLTRR